MTSTLFVVNFGASYSRCYYRPRVNDLRLSWLKPLASRQHKNSRTIVSNLLVYLNFIHLIE